MSNASRFRRSLRGKPDRKLVSAIMLFFFSAFLLIALKGELHWQGFVLAAVVPLLIYIATMWLPRFFPADKLLLSIANFLCALGVLVLYSTDLVKGTNYGMQQAVYYGAGIVAMLFCILLVRYIRYWGVFIYIIAVCAIGLIVLPLVFGTEIYGATNWIIVSGISLQPSEIVKLALLLVLSYYMSRRRFWLWLLFAVFCMGVLMFQADLGTALIYYATALLLYYASTGNLWITGVGLLGGAASAVFGYYEFAHVKRRIAVWRNPWMDFENTGYQIVQILMAIASGGLLGVGARTWLPHHYPRVPYRRHLRRDLRAIRYHLRRTGACDVRHPHPARRVYRAQCPAQLSWAFGDGRHGDARAADLCDHWRGFKTHPADGRHHAVCQLRRHIAGQLHGDDRPFAGSRYRQSG